MQAIRYMGRVYRVQFGFRSGFNVEGSEFSP